MRGATKASSNIYRFLSVFVQQMYERRGKPCQGAAAVDAAVVEPSSTEPSRCSALGVILNRYKPETGLRVGVLLYKQCEPSQRYSCAGCAVLTLGAACLHDSHGFIGPFSVSGAVISALWPDWVQP